MKYLVKHWLNVDMIAEEVIEDDTINFSNNNLGKYNEPSKNANYKVIDNIKVKRTTYEKYDEKFNNSSKDSFSNK
mgnify:FL=1